LSSDTLHLSDKEPTSPRHARPHLPYSGPSVDAMVSHPPPMNADVTTAKAAEAGANRPSGFDSPRVISSDTLLAGDSQLAILHNQTIYFLRQTRFGKLILTK
jgi:hemin uptake protein HemP